MADDLPDHPTPSTQATGPGEPDRGSTTGTPTWVKAFAIVALILALLFAFSMLTGIGGQHGPGRHIPSVGPGVDTAPAAAPDDHRPPTGDHIP